MTRILPILLACLASGCAATMPPTAGSGAAASAPPAPERPQLAQDEANLRMMAGLQTRTIEAGDLTRKYYVHVPQGVSRPAPLLFMLHGGSSTAPRRARQTGFNAIADRSTNDFDFSEEAWAFVSRFRR